MSNFVKTGWVFVEDMTKDILVCFLVHSVIYSYTLLFCLSTHQRVITHVIVYLIIMMTKASTLWSKKPFFISL